MGETVQTARLTLVPFTVDHLEAFHTIWSDSEATTWSIHGRNTTLSASSEWMAGVLRTSENDLRRSWAVYISGSTESNQCIGMVALLPGTRIPGDEERTATSGVWELGFLYRPESWGKGYATESCAAGIDSLRQDLDGAGQHPDIAKIVAQVHPGNEGSLKVCRKLGFKEVERRNYGGEKKFLSGQWRDNEVVVFEKEI